MPKSMSEPKNTALGGAAGFGYAHVSPTKPPDAHFANTHAMITATVILSALAFLISADSSENRPE